MALVDAYVRSAVERFETTEAAALPPITRTRPSIAAVGSVARKSLTSPLLREQLANERIEPEAYRPCTDLEDLFRQTDWSLALVLSPFKQAVRNWCDDLTMNAERSGVVDTIVQDESGKRVGVNTNALGAAWAIRHLMGGARLGRCLIAGTGASARSCLVGLHDLYGEVEIGVLGRSRDRTGIIAKEFSIAVVEDIGNYAPDLVINATTVGETRDDEPQFPLEKALSIGTRYFDLNNRTSALQVEALGRGCVTLSGILMQSVVNALRVHLLTRSRLD